MISIIVETKIIRFLMDDSTYLDYIIGKLNIAIPSIVIHRANVKAYIDYKIAQKRIKTHELNFIRKIVTNKKKRSKKTVRYSVVDPEIWETILKAEKSAQAKKEANAKKAAQKKDQSAKKKAAAEAKKIAAAANRVTNKAAKAAEEATKIAEKIAAKTNPKNNRKDKKTGHSQNIKNLENAIQHLFLELDSEAKIIKEKNIVEQLNTELQAATNETSRNKFRPQRTTRAPLKRYL
jgi:histone H1/5